MIRIKTDAEIECMRKSGRLTGDLLKYLEKEIRPGMSTKTLDKLAYEFIRENGATPSFLNYAGYPASTCISIDETVVHGIPSDDIIIKEGQIVSVDVGVIYNGWHGDAARRDAVRRIAERSRAKAGRKRCPKMFFGVRLVFVDSLPFWG